MRAWSDRELIGANSRFAVTGSESTDRGVAVDIEAVLDMSTSLDGFIAGPNERLDNGLGDGGHRLHEWALTGADADRKEVAHPAGVNGKSSTS
jgi:hypothetical protein